MMNIKNLLIKRIVEISHKAKEGHIGSSLSILDILFVLYGTVLKNKQNHFILSKGHASLGYFTVLEYYGLLEESLDNYCKFDSKLGGHPSNKLNYVESSTGSLGHGLPMAVGIAMGERIKKSDKKTYVIIGDGESNEGTIWESALLASNHKLNNLYCIMDYNRSNDRSLKLDSIIDKFKSFNWNCIEIDGHNHNEIMSAISTESTDKPTFILANTTKGKGIKMMENNPEWHHKSPTDQQLIEIIEELEIKN